jgi:hypothetical protein
MGRAWRGAHVVDRLRARRHTAWVFALHLTGHRALARQMVRPQYGVGWLPCVLLLHILFTPSAAELLLDGPLLEVSQRVFTAPAAVKVELRLAPHFSVAGICVDARLLLSDGGLGPLLTTNCTLAVPWIWLHLAHAGTTVLQFREATHPPGRQSGVPWLVVHVSGGDVNMLRALRHVLTSIVLLLSACPVLSQLQLAHACGRLSLRLAQWHNPVHAATNTEPPGRPAAWAATWRPVLI